MAYLKASRPRLAEKVAHIALQSGLSESLREQITAVPPTIGAEMLFLLLRLAPADTITLHYELTEDGYLPRPEAGAGVVEQIIRFAEGVGRLFTALASEKREMTDLGAESLGQAVLDSLSGRYLSVAMRAAHRSVALHLISAIQDNDVVLDTGICQDILQEMQVMVADAAQVQSSVVAEILVKLHEAEEYGQFAFPDERLLADELWKVVDVKNINVAMVHATDDVMLSLLARLAKHLETKRRMPLAGWAAIRYAQAFRRPGPGVPCMICEGSETSDPVKVLLTAEQMEAVLRRGSHEDPRRAIGWATGESPRIDGFFGVPEALSRLDDDYIATELLGAAPGEAGDIVIALQHADRNVAMRVREHLTEPERRRILEGLTMDEHHARLRFRAFHQFALGAWVVDATSSNGSTSRRSTAPPAA